MIDDTQKDDGLDEERRAEQVAELADRIARGETPDLGLLDATNPGRSEALERLLPAIRLLSELAGEEPTAEYPVYGAPPSNVLGDFQLGHEIGRGGFGVVYEARQLSLGRRVAVKVLAPASRLDPRQLRRFEIEAQAAAALQHPNIVPVFAYGNDCGVPYLAMRLIDGQNLGKVVRDRCERSESGLPPREAAELAKQAAEALDYAHHHDVLHRDVKPSNFLVDADGRLWVADFGLARVRGDSDLTASGDVLGTLRYLSPEQAKGHRGVADGRSDVYALGATLYELLTLRPVFDGDDRAEMLVRILSEEPRFSRKLDAAIPLDLKTIVLKAIAKDPAERYATAGEMASDLALFLADQPIRARPPTVVALATRWARRHWKAAAVAGLMMALLLIGAVAASLWSNARLWGINQRLQAERDRADRHAREAQDQARLAERHAVGAQLRLAAQAIDSGQPERAQEILRDLPTDAGGELRRSFVWRYLWRRARRDVTVLVGPMPKVGDMALSPDGKTLATTDRSEGLVLRDAVTGERTRPLATGSGQLGKPAFSPDGLLVAAAERTTDKDAPDGFSIWDVGSGRRLARLAVGRALDLYGCFLPGGTFLGFWHRDEPSRPRVVRVWTLADGPGHPRLVEQFEALPTLAYNDNWDGGELLTHEDRSTVSLRDANTGKSVRAFRIDAADGNIAAAACSAGAEIVAAVSESPPRLTSWDGRTGKRLAGHPVPPDIKRLSFSPGGATLAAIDNRQRVFLINRVSGVVWPIAPGTVDPKRISKMAFSPDGSRLATAMSGRSRQGDPTRVSISETATGRLLATFPGRAEELRNLIFGADGRSLLISSKTDVRRWRLAPGEADADHQPVGHKDEAWGVAFSPDGRTLATGSDDSEPDLTIKLWDPATGRLRTAWMGGVGTVASLAFSPDGRFLASGHITDRGHVRIWDAATGRPLATLEGHTDRIRAVAFARDGGMLASTGSDGTIRLWDVASWHEREVLRGHADTVHALAFSPDGRMLASAGNDGDIRLWDLSSGDGSGRLARVLPNRANLMALAFAPDGKTLAVADTLGSITVWDPDRSISIRTIHGDGDEVRQVAFAPDGTVLAAAGIKGQIRLWDPVTGQELLSLSAHRAQVNGLAFSPDGRTLASAAHDGAVKLWRAEVIEPALARSFCETSGER
jgi:eukaryotic-like serine/threonine-protein kinase